MELSKQAENLRPTIPSEFMRSTSTDLGVNQDLLKKEVEALPDASYNVKAVKFKDYYAEERQRLDNVYGHKDELKKLFNKWNNYDQNKDDLSCSMRGKR